ncbi:hypothetical protein [Clavibacter sp. VKM Ac-2872]|uniref:DUF7574 domain-containing protein n=1 Tax=Clavibacter sp. VKM Ac-2872 TaxID=2783812 RepID=UPI00188AE7DB|nr:hypothetical protein [Clavibacter sp. VKM Ac-2872]MBF4625509.1 hypothetical protein [Clavibacter sp. VKM Ac-2872]
MNDTASHQAATKVATPKLDRIEAAGTRDSDFKRTNDNQITCQDGFGLSVVAGYGAYCEPRPDWPGSGAPRDYPGPYARVEVGFPTERPEPWAEWDAWCEDPASPTETVYDFVPVAAVRALIELHGGEAVGEVAAVGQALVPVATEVPVPQPYDPNANPYYDPAAAGLEILFQDDDQDACYSFDMVVIWGSPASGAVYMATDSGCSCPSPFEGYAGPAGLASMNRLDPTRREHMTESIRAAIDAIDERKAPAVTEAVQKAVAAIEAFGARQAEGARS